MSLSYLNQLTSNNLSHEETISNSLNESLEIDDTSDGTTQLQSSLSNQTSFNNNNNNNNSSNINNQIANGLINNNNNTGSINNNSNNNNNATTTTTNSSNIISYIVNTITNEIVEIKFPDESSRNQWATLVHTHITPFIGGG